MYKRMVVVIALVSLVALGSVFAQNSLENVHLFQNFMRDATITSTPYGEGGLSYSNYNYYNNFSLGAQGGYPVMPEMLEVNASLNFVSFSPDQGDGQSGLSDLLVSGRYKIVSDNVHIAAGGFITLPIGKEEVGAGKLNFGAFGALRYPLENGMIITGTLGLDFYETKKYEGGGYKIVNGIPVIEELKEKTEYENTLVLGGGVIYPVNDQLSAVGELNLHTQGDYMLLSGGADYVLNSNSRVRGALGIGLDSGAPDLQLLASYLIFF
ncbi:MAG: hypothetical protein GXO75_16830 [Calditrichaeota bacterium]|nr:hypothetical protein [Calditrichota bacterium]